MKRYSKIKLINSTKSRSMDFSDLQSFPHEKTEPIPLQTTSKTQKTRPIKKTHIEDEDEDEDDHEHYNEGERRGFSMMNRLSRNGSKSTTPTASGTTTSASSRFRLEKQNNIVQTAVKMAFSMRRSSSVSEKYCRIHDQCVTLASPTFGEEEEEQGINENNGGVQKTSVKNKKHSKGSVLKACKRFFGL